MSRRMLPLGLGTLAIVAAACETPAPPPPPPPTRLVLADSVDHFDALAREAMVVQHPGGALFVSGYGDTLPHLWTSTDNGASWQAVAVGTLPGAAGNSDVDLAVGPEGTLYLMTMVFNRATLEGASMQVAVSHDTGATWTWHQLSKTRFDDRPWIEVAPDGVAHAIWNDGAGVAHAISADRGRTWHEQERVFSVGGSSHLAIGPRGEIAVRGVPISASGNAFNAGADSIAVSTDQGRTWQRRAAPGSREWFPMRDTTVTPPTWGMPAQPRWVEPIAWDSTGALYSFWASGPSLMLARSTDQGVTWSTWKVAEAAATPYFPYLIARGNGELAASWFTGAGDSLRANVARIQVAADTSAPLVASAPSFQIESFGMAAFEQPPTRDPGGEYLALVFLRDGTLGIVSPIQNGAAGRTGFAWRRYRSQR